MRKRRRAATRRLVALAATVTLLGAQPAVLCGMLCLATHTPAAPVAQHHHGAAEAPCRGGEVAAADGVPVELHAAGAALPASLAVELPLAHPRRTDTGFSSRRALPPPPDVQPPPPRS